MESTYLNFKELEKPVLVKTIDRKIKSIRLQIKINKQTLNSEILITGYHLTQDKVLTLIKSHEKWIIKKIKDNNQKKNLFDLEEIKNKNIFYLFGQSYILKLTDIKDMNYQIKDNTIYVLDKNNIKKLRDYYLTKIIDIFNEYQKIFAYDCKMEFKDMISKYGYCVCNNRKIVLSKRLVHLPINLIEYVIIHEFCHFKQPNHSKQFYNEVYKYCPDYRECIKQLKQYSIICKEI